MSIKQGDNIGEAHSNLDRLEFKFDISPGIFAPKLIRIQTDWNLNSKCSIRNNWFRHSNLDRLEFKYDNRAKLYEKCKDSNLDRLEFKSNQHRNIAVDKFEFEFRQTGI